MVTPFVFRRYLDYNVFEALRVLHQQIRAQSLRLSAGRPERANDVKLGRGGIREIEFTVQLLQVVRGGQFPELRQRATLDTLASLVQARLMPADTAQALHEAYVFCAAWNTAFSTLMTSRPTACPATPPICNGLPTPWGWLAATTCYQFCNSTVTASPKSLSVCWAKENPHRPIRPTPRPQ